MEPNGRTLWVAGLLASSILAGAYADETCVMNGPEDKQICVALPGPTVPIEGSHFYITYDGNDDNPKVELVSGDIWTIYSEGLSGGEPSGAPANIGDILIHQDAATTATFRVKIKNGTGNGASNLGSIDLDGAAVSGWTGWSAIEDMLISGDVSGHIQVIRSSGSGGTLSRVNIIGGDVSGDIAIPILDVGSFLIAGDVDGHIDIGTVEALHTLTVEGLVTDPEATKTDVDAEFDQIKGLVKLSGDMTDANLTFKILDMDGGTFKLNGGSSSAWFSGTIILDSGVPENSEVFVEWFHGTVDLTADDVAGELLFAYVRDGSGSKVENGGDISGRVLYGYANLFGQTVAGGAATFTGITSTGDLQVQLLDLTGTITFQNDVDGEILVVSGGLTDTGKIDIQGDATGTGITVDEDCDGVISIGGDVEDGFDITIKGDLLDTGKITVDGECQGTVNIEQATISGSLIHMKGSVGDRGSVVVNGGEGNHNAGGTITVGTLSGSPIGGNYDGAITIRDNAGGCAGSYGDLNGTIRIAVCDDEADDHIVCVEGDTNGSIDVVDTACAQQAPQAVCLSCP